MTSPQGTAGTGNRESVEQAREELGDTVEALAQKTDVKTQAQEKLADSKEALRAKGEQLKEKVSELGEKVPTEQLKEKATELTQKVQAATPERAQQAAGQAVEKVKERPLPFTAVAAFVSGIVFGRLLRRKKK